MRLAATLLPYVLSVFSKKRRLKGKNLMSNIEDRQLKRFLFLKRVYVETEGSSTAYTNVDEFTAKYGYTREERNDLIIYAKEKGLLARGGAAKDLTLTP